MCHRRHLLFPSTGRRQNDGACGPAALKASIEQANDAAKAWALVARAGGEAAGSALLQSGLVNREHLSEPPSGLVPEAVAAMAYEQAFTRKFCEVCCVCCVLRVCVCVSVPSFLFPAHPALRKARHHMGIDFVRRRKGLSGWPRRDGSVGFDGGSSWDARNETAPRARTRPFWISATPLLIVVKRLYSYHSISGSARRRHRTWDTCVILFRVGNGGLRTVWERAVSERSGNGLGTVSRATVVRRRAARREGGWSLSAATRRGRMVSLSAATRRGRMVSLCGDEAREDGLSLCGDEAKRRTEIRVTAARPSGHPLARVTHSC